MVTLRLKGRHTNTSIIQCYPLTNDSEDESKDYFYEQLERELTGIPRHDLIVVMGDLNAKVGEDNTNYWTTMGQLGTGTIHENGERLVDFCALNNLVIGGTLFPKSTIHKLTWNSPNGRNKHQIDHPMIGGMWRRSVQGVKLSDGNVRSAFRLELKNRFQALQDLEETTPNTDEVNTQGKHIVEAYTESSKTCFGVKEKNASKEWIQQGTWNTIEERRKIKKRQLAAKSIRLQEKYAEDCKEACQKVKRLVKKTHKREAMEKLATEAEETAAKGEQGNVYKITRIICGKYHGGTSGPIKDKAGKLLTIEKEQEARWTEHFREVLNQHPPEDTPDIQEATLDLDISSDPPQKHEIVKAVKSLKSRKSPGMDNLNTELFKVDSELTAAILQPLFKTIW
ncbi:uncharacterized protein LOC106012092 [Aplysia californica]|uniref:Uncharacterized protein LOC106012092 n=1 Tax=Aplysia californica TaxID=6500 RepID=A0ABM1A258_APLCA|nr:uncharacterized protein LOC106012092 [Aplysia californica]